MLRDLVAWRRWVAFDLGNRYPEDFADSNPLFQGTRIQLMNAFYAGWFTFLIPTGPCSVLMMCIPEIPRLDVFVLCIQGFTRVFVVRSCNYTKIGNTKEPT